MAASKPLGSLSAKLCLLSGQLSLLSLPAKLPGPFEIIDEFLDGLDDLELPGPGLIEVEVGAQKPLDLPRGHPVVVVVASDCARVEPADLVGLTGADCHCSVFLSLGDPAEVAPAEAPVDLAVGQRLPEVGPVSGANLVEVAAGVEEP